LKNTISKEEKEASYDSIKAAYDTTIENVSVGDEEMAFDEVIRGYANYIEALMQYQRRLGLFANSEQAVFINGKLYLISDEQVRPLRTVWCRCYSNAILIFSYSHGCRS
jgi:hypothetical protein